MEQQQQPEVITLESISRVTPTRLFGPHDTFLTAVAFSADATRLLTGDIAGYVRVWDLQSGKQLVQRRLFPDAVLSAAFGTAEADDEYVFVVASRTDQVTVLTLTAENTLTTVHDLKLDAFTPLRVGYDTLSRPLIACVANSAFDKRIYLMHADDKGFISAFNVGNEENPNATLDATGAFVLVGGLDGRVAFRSTVPTSSGSRKIQTDLDGIKQTAISADGKRFAALEDKGDRLLVYSVESGNRVGPEINEPFQGDFAFSYDGALLAVTRLQKGGSLHIYNVETGERVRRIRGSSPLAFSPNTRSFAAGNNYAEFSKSIMLWDTRESEGSVLAKVGAPLDIIAAEEQTVRQFAVFNDAHDGMVLACAFSPDGMTMATSGTDDDIHLWDLETGGQSATLLDHRADVNGLAYAPDGKMLASASGYFSQRDDNTVRLWDTDENMPRLVFSKHRDKLVDVLFHPRGEVVISADAGGRVLVWRALNGEVTRSIDTGTPINRVALSPDGALVATAHGTELSVNDRALRLWNVQTGEKVREYTDMSDWVMHVTFSPDGNVILASDYSKRTVGWDLNSGRMVLDLAEGEMARYNPQNNLIALAHEKTVKLISVRGSNPKMELRHGDKIKSMGFNDEGELLAVCLQDGAVVVWGVPEGAGVQSSTGELEQRRVSEASRSGRYALQLISLSCNKAQERDGDEVFIRVDGQTIWSVKRVGRKMFHKPHRHNDIDTFDFSGCRMHGKNGWQDTTAYTRDEFRFGGLTGPLELELWEEDLFLRGGNDFVGTVVVTPAQAGQSMIRTVLDNGPFSYTLTYGVLFE